MTDSENPRAMAYRAREASRVDAERPCRTCNNERFVNRWNEAENRYDDVPSPCPECNPAEGD